MKFNLDSCLRVIIQQGQGTCAVQCMVADQWARGETSTVTNSLPARFEILTKNI